MIDQTLLPQRLVYKSFDTWEGVADAIRRMVVRGAPAIGVAAAMGVAVAAQRSKATTREALLIEIGRAAGGLRSTRPTAVNLFWGIDRVVAAAKGAGGGVDKIVRAAVSTAIEMAEEDVEANRRLGKVGERLLDDGDVVMTQCNAGALATVGYGTALGVVRAASEAGKCIKVIVNETRPALQGSRLTAFELVRDGFHCTLISDTAVGHMLSRGQRRQSRRRRRQDNQGRLRLQQDWDVPGRCPSEQARHSFLSCSSAFHLRHGEDPREGYDRGEGR